MTLSDIHRQYLLDHAITDETIDRHAIRSEDDVIVFPWQDGDLVTEQRRPWPGESGVYFWETDKDLHFWDLGSAGPNSPILLVEGTKQSLAAASHAPHEFSVMGMAGCWGWSKAKLGRFKGREVYLCLDADAASNLDVFEAGEKLGEKLKRYGVSLRYLRIPGSGSQGLDDYLASLDEDERADILAYEISEAQSKPAERRPTGRKRKMESDLPDTGDRVPVAINLDRKMVIDKVVDALKVRHDGKDLFNYGEVLTRVKGHETQPLDRDRFYAMLADAVACFRYTEATDKRPALFEPAWPDPPSIGAVMSKAEEFSPLRRVVRVPFLRPDGTICSTPGYDRETATVLVRSGLGELTVPSVPSKDQTVMAAKLLMHDWLGDLPFESDADAANALAMILTPFMRGSVPLVPLAVVNGLEAGVGKNLLADCAAILATGEAARPLPYVNQEEEMRKQITAAFAGGAELFIFDEAHVVEGTQFARAVTSLTYTDRVLGVSRMASFPNQVTWMSLGNQVQVNGDMSRRVYFVCLSPAGTTLSDRESYSYRHPDLKTWTSEHRTELVSAALTVLSGWVAAGRPTYSRGASMGSFEPWDRFMSGVLAYAGFPDFLTDSRKRRSESDFVQAYWEAHVAWLYGVFGAEEFTTRQVQEAALRDPQKYEAPPGLEDASGKSFTRTLGQGYSKHRNRTYNGLRLVKAGMGHKSTLKWQIDPGSEGQGGKGGNPTSSTVWGKGPLEDTCEGGMRVREGAVAIPPIPPVPSKELDAVLSAHQEDLHAALQPLVETYSAPVPSEAENAALAELTALGQEQNPSGYGPAIALGFDLETASAEELFTGGHEGPFVRLGGVVQGDVTDVMTGDDPGILVDLDRADVIYGHNILGFDLLALAHHHGADYDKLAEKSIDTLVLARLVDPPVSKGMPNGYYKLGEVSERLGGPGKTDHLPALAKRYGGYDKIPVDSREYQDYLKGDLAATKYVYEGLLHDRGGVLSAYAEREMKVVALQNRMTLNGWRVDEKLLAERVAHEDAQRAAAVEILHRDHGMPTHEPDRVRPFHKYADRPDGSALLSIEDARALTFTDPDEAIRLGVARLVKGKPYASPWATDLGKSALIEAFKRAGADSWPTSAKTGALLTSADAMGEDDWYDKNRKKNIPGMLQVHGAKPGVRAIVEALNLATGARAKYAEIAQYVTSEGRVHAGIGDAQGSGRWAMTKPSLTNMGIRGAAGQERGVMVADAGHLLLTCDLSQVDMRAMAALSQDPAYMELFLPGRDAHMEMAEVYFGARTPEFRQRTKRINHKLNYGGGVESTSVMEKIDREIVQQAYDARMRAYPKLIEYIQSVRNLAETGALLDNGFGRLMRPNPERAATQAPALVGQGAARDIMCESLLRLVRIADESGRNVRPYLRGVVHDEVILSVPSGEVGLWSGILEQAFTWTWRDVPILCEVGKPAFRWSDCK